MKIINFKEINKGSLLAKFDVQIDQWGGLTIRDCCIFSTKDRNGKFVALPNKQYQAKDGTQKSYGLVSFDKEMNQRFQNKCLELIEKGQYEQRTPAPEGSLNNNNMPF